MTDVIRTCAESLLTPGACCFSICRDRATQAVLTAQHDHLVEHARCKVHVNAEQPNFVATKPLLWDPEWGPLGFQPAQPGVAPSSSERQRWERRIGGTDVAEAHLHVEIGTDGRARVHEAVLAQLLVDAGWERTA